jgi:hypothetical protein
VAALASAADIPPGGEGAIKASVQTRGRSGPLNKTITVETSDPDNSRVRLQLKVAVISEAAFEPRSLNFGQLGTGETVTKSATFVARDPSKVKLTGVEVVAETEGITAKITKIEGRDAVEVSYRGAKVGTIRGLVKVSTTSEKRPTLDLMVRGIVLGNWEVLPRSVSFPSLEDGGEPVSRSIHVKARKQTSFRVTKAVDESGSVRAKVTKAPDGFTVDLTLAKVPESRRGVVVISTTDPQEKAIEARYFVRSKRDPLQNRSIEALKQKMRPMPVPTPPRED